MDTFEKIIGYEDVKHELYRVCDTMKNSEKYKKMGVRTPHGILLYGNPGIGKTMMANAVIHESGRKAFVLRKDRPDEEFINYIREVFEEAKKSSPCIVFLDDLDKFSDQDSTEEYATIQTCIDECQEYEVFVLATVNFIHDIPNSLLRAGRFDHIIQMDVPVKKDIAKITEYYLNQKKNLGNIDVEEIANLLLGYSCADLEKVINQAGIYAAYEGKEKIEQEDMIKACMRIIFNAPECVNPEECKVSTVVATHEAGHAVIAEVFNPGSVSLVSIKAHTNGTNGVTKVIGEGKANKTKEDLEKRIIRYLGGKAAIEILDGVADVGCEIDLNKVFNLTRKLVKYYCTLGFDAWDKINGTSEYVIEKGDRLVATEVEKYYQTAKNILIHNRQFLIEVRDTLLEKESLMAKDISEIHSKYLS